MRGNYRVLFGHTELEEGRCMRMGRKMWMGPGDRFECICAEVTIEVTRQGGLSDTLAKYVRVSPAKGILIN